MPLHRQHLLLASISTPEIRLQVLEGMPNYGWRVLISGLLCEMPALAFQHEPDVLLFDIRDEGEYPHALEVLNIPRVALANQLDRASMLQIQRQRKICSILPLPLDLEVLTATLEAIQFGAGKSIKATAAYFEPRGGEVPGQWLLSRTKWILLAPHNIKIQLTQAESTFLAMLGESPGVPVPRATMISALGHNPAYFDPRRIDTMVSRLRQKISRETSGTLPVRSIHSVGYAFAASITLED